FDNRGAGRTTLPAGPFSVATMADDAAALLRALEIPAAHVAGLSGGSKPKTEPAQFIKTPAHPDPPGTEHPHLHPGWAPLACAARGSESGGSWRPGSSQSVILIRFADMTERSGHSIGGLWSRRRDVTVYPAELFLADKVIDEGVRPVPLPGEPP